VQADILMVTDGEIPSPSNEVQDRLKAAHDSMGLEVHGLLVGGYESPAMKEITCVQPQCIKGPLGSCLLL